MAEAVDGEPWHVDRCLALSWAARSTLSFRGEWPSPAGNSNASRPRVGCWSAQALSAGSRWGGIATDRMPALVLGGPIRSCPLSRTTAWRTWTTPVSRSRSRTRSPRTSPELSPTPAGQEQRHPPSLWHSSQVSVQLVDREHVDLPRTLFLAARLHPTGIRLDEALF